MNEKAMIDDEHYEHTLRAEHVMMKFDLQKI